MKKDTLIVVEKSSMKHAIKEMLEAEGITNCDVYATGGRAYSKSDNLIQVEEEELEKSPLMEGTPEKVWILGSVTTDKNIDVIKEAMAKNDYKYVINACDSDKWGDYLFQYVRDKASIQLPVFRMCIHDITRHGLYESYKNAIEGIRTAVRRDQPQQLADVVGKEQLDKLVDFAIAKLTPSEIYEKMKEADKDALYHMLRSDYVRKDVKTYCEDMDILLNEDGIEEVVNRYVYNGDYDCNQSYWDNIDNLAKETYENEAYRETEEPELE
jgi:DNA topoisomerase IA